jgi:hypothetical protein
MADPVKCKVIGPAEVLGVSAPGEVELDADLYNIDALVQGGHVEVLAPAKKKTTGGNSGSAES